MDKKLFQLAMGSGVTVGAVNRRLAALSKVHGEDIYTKFIHLISHLDFTPEEAKKHWKAIATHTGEMSQTLGRSVDFRVGMADYFVDRTAKIRHPKIIEIHLFQETEAGNLKDGLTGLYNYRYLSEALCRELSQASRLGHPMGLIFLDVDNFKAYNDKLGHALGNDALIKVAATVRKAIREMDLPCRYGGEEFAVLLPATDKTGALAVAQRIVENVQALKIHHPGPSKYLTVSAGVASFPLDAEDAAPLIQAADQAMYIAKSRGKNRAVAFTSERRAHARYPLKFRGSLAKGKESLTLSGRDISQNGLYFTCDRDIQPGEEVELYLDFPCDRDQTRLVSCRAKIARCLPLGSGGFGIGVSLTNIQPTDRLHFFQVISQARETG